MQKLLPLKSNKVLKNLFADHSGKLILMIIIFLIASTSYLIISNKKSKPDEENQRQKELTISCLISLTTGFISSALVVLAGTKNIKQYIKDSEYNKKISNLKDFWENQNSDLKENQKIQFIIVVIIHEDEFKKSDVQCEYIAAAYQLIDTINKIYGCDNVSVDIFIRHDDYYKKNTSVSYEKANVIILGCGSSSSKMREVASNMNIFYHQRINDNLFQIKCPKKVKGFESTIIEHNSNTSCDFTSINRFSIGKRLFIIFNCCQTQGLLGAVSHVTDSEKFKTTKFLDSIANNPIPSHPTMDNCDYRHAIIQTNFNHEKIRDTFSSLQFNSCVVEKIFTEYQLDQESAKYENAINDLFKLDSNESAKKKTLSNIS